MSVLPGSLYLAAPCSLRNLMILKPFPDTFWSWYLSCSAVFLPSLAHTARHIVLFSPGCIWFLWPVKWHFGISCTFTNCTIQLCPTCSIAALGRTLSDESRSYEVSNLGSRLCSHCAARSWRNLLSSESCRVSDLGAVCYASFWITENVLLSRKLQSLGEEESSLAIFAQ